MAQVHGIETSHERHDSGCIRTATAVPEAPASVQLTMKGKAER